ncbi:uncharacterized protein LOC132912137 [Bombus pascuorum]|uniref:uncharacterized protein LOC132912137 n=1 Tax=Bombus pascuorum TaxID=65598 RepID=UPI00298EA1AB|nr:uncharacterized protein LOC132912137 [Bombus pascuorum]
MKANSKQHFVKETTWDTGLCDFTRIIDKAKLEMTQWEILLENERSDSNQFLRSFELNWERAKLARKNIQESLEQKIKIRTAKFSSKLSATNLKNEVRKRSVKVEVERFDLRMKSLDGICYLRMNDLCNERYKARERCLGQFEKYDRNIGSLYVYKLSLRIRQNLLNKEYAILQDHLVAQRRFHKRLKEESELDVRRAFLANVEYFRSNHAARIIQRNWKLYCARMSWKKRKSRRLTQN